MYQRGDSVDDHDTRLLTPLEAAADHAGADALAKQKQSQKQKRKHMQKPNGAGALGVGAAAGKSAAGLFSSVRGAALRHRKHRIVGRLFSRAVLSCLLYSLTSISMMLSNKVILSGFNFRFDMVLLFAQNIVCVLFLRLARRLGWCTFEDLDLRKAWHWLPLNLLFVGMLLTGFMSLTRLAIPFVVVFKNFSSVLVTVGDFVLYGQTVSRGIVGCLALMMTGAVSAGYSDVSLDPLGILFAAVNCSVSAIYVLYMPVAMSKTKLSSFGKVYYHAVLSLPATLVIDMCVFGDFERLLRAPTTRQFLDPTFLGVLAFSGVLGFAISLASFNCVANTSPTTYSMTGSLTKIPTTILGILFFNVQLNAKSVVFISLSLVAGILYAYTKSMEEEKKKRRESTGSFDAELGRPLAKGAGATGAAAAAAHSSNNLSERNRTPSATNLEGIGNGDAADRSHGGHTPAWRSSAATFSATPGLGAGAGAGAGAGGAVPGSGSGSGPGPGDVATS